MFVADYRVFSIYVCSRLWSFLNLCLQQIIVLNLCLQQIIEFYQFMFAADYRVLNLCLQQIKEFS